MNLASLSNINGSQRGAEAIGLCLTHSPVMALLDRNSAFELDATSFDWRPSVGSMTIEARAVGGYYTAADMSPTAKQTGSLAIHGFSHDYDITYQADVNKNLKDFPVWFAKELKKKVELFAKGYDNLLFTGSGLTHIIKGLAKIVDGSSDLPGYTGVTATLNAAPYNGSSAKSFDLTSADNYNAFIEMFYYAISQVDLPKAIVVNSTLYGRLQTIARLKSMLGVSLDSYNGVPIETFAGIPLVKVSTSTITSTEADDTSGTPLANTTSMWILSPGEQRLSLVTNSGIYYMPYDHVDNKESFREKMEIRAAWKIEEPKSILRIRNIKI